MQWERIFNDPKSEEAIQATVHGEPHFQHME